MIDSYTATNANDRAAAIARAASQGNSSANYTVESLDVRQFMPKGSKLKNTLFVYAIVAYTGK